jgi:hypothetical protein
LTDSARNATAEMLPQTPIRRMSLLEGQTI